MERREQVRLEHGRDLRQNSMGACRVSPAKRGANTETAAWIGHAARRAISGERARADWVEQVWWGGVRIPAAGVARRAGAKDAVRFGVRPSRNQVRPVSVLVGLQGRQKAGSSRPPTTCNSLVARDACSARGQQLESSSAPGRRAQTGSGDGEGAEIPGAGAIPASSLKGLYPSRGLTPQKRPAGAGPAPSFVSSSLMPTPETPSQHRPTRALLVPGFRCFPAHLGAIDRM